MDLLKAVQNGMDTCRSLWALPLEGETDAPDQRLIHTRVFQFSQRTRVDHIELSLGTGYFKCGSAKVMDYIQDLRILVYTGGGMQCIQSLHDLEQPAPAHKIDLGGIETACVVCEIRKSAVDGYWTCWNTAMNCLSLHGEVLAPLDEVENMRGLLQSTVTEQTVPGTLQRSISQTEVAFQSPMMKVSLMLGRPSFSWLSIDETCRGKTYRNMLKHVMSPIGTWHFPHSQYYVHGPLLHPVGQPEALGMYTLPIEGTTVVDGNRVAYDFELSGCKYHIAWTVYADGLDLEMIYKNIQPIEAWNSCMWQVPFETKETPAALLGDLVKQGQNGICALPATIHAPGCGSMVMQSTEGNVQVRFDSSRPDHITLLQIKLDETPTDHGTYVISAGIHAAKITLRIQTPRLLDGSCTAPDAVRQMLRLRSATAVTYRADTDTLSNNANSMHAPVCMDYWGELMTRMKDTDDGIRPMRILRNSLERWLTGAPAYASGRSGFGADSHEYEDEYLHSGAASILGLSLYLQKSNDRIWYDKHSVSIQQALEHMRLRDLDGDGLVESAYRRGVSGEHQWSTCWYDVISFGWKDAFSNAILYKGLRILSGVYARWDDIQSSQALILWADRLKLSYRQQFFNPATGWFAGWLCKEGRLHDYAFLFVNGAAIDAGITEGQEARTIMERLYRELMGLDFNNYELGLPGNLRHIPDSDVAKLIMHMPLGTYQNGSATHSQARHFLTALYKVGMTEEADRLLLALAKSMADGSAFGGIESGQDWRMWDGTYVGYEGILCDQFGVLIPAADRYGIDFT